LLVTRTADQEIQPAAVRIATDLFQGLNCCQTLTAFPLPELPRIIFGFKIKLRLAFIRKASWIDLRDRSTFFIGNSTTQKTIIYSASEQSRWTVPRDDGPHNIR